MCTSQEINSVYTLDITHYYIANDNCMADFQFYASETVINHRFKWKLKRPDSALINVTWQ